MSTYLAVDFGGGSGRVMAGRVSDAGVELDEVYRFENYQVRLGAHLYWDFPYLFREMLKGLGRAARRYDDIVSIGIDTWGVDFGLIDPQGNLLGNPRCYRDEANTGMAEKLFETLDIDGHYSRAGIQVLDINTIFQLLVRKAENPALLEAADRLLFTPDLFSYYLTGVANNEYCIASTSELLDARTRNWNWELIDTLGLPRHIFGPIVMPGTERGVILPQIADETGLPRTVKVIAVGSHDTASAVNAVPFKPGKESVSAFLSSGTWSLLGALVPEPILSREAREADFTNEGGVGGKIRFLSNITGMWILQCLIGEWKEAGMETDYGHMLGEAEKAGFEAIFDVDDPVFAAPGHMEEKIKAYFTSRGQRAPEGQGEVVQCVLRSLADRYRRGIEGLNKLLPKPVECIHIIGGGSRNQLLNRLTEEATGLPVIAGPVEATAIGNIMVQAQADRH